MIRAIRSHLRARDLEVLGTLARRGSAPPSLVGQRVATPNGFARILCGDPGPGVNSLADQLEAVAEIDPDEFLASVAGCVGDSPSESWAALYSDPSRWLQAYAGALLRAWQAVGPIWERARGLIEMEGERVEAALERGAGAALVVGLHGRAAASETHWLIPTDQDPQTYRLAPHLVIAPMLTDPTTTAIFSDGTGALPTLFYACAGGSRAYNGEAPAPASLEALVGTPRARILAALERPLRAGELAAILQTAPGGATHHLRLLEAAGLVIRVRDGRWVVVERTRRGTALLALYGLD